MKITKLLTGLALCAMLTGCGAGNNDKNTKVNNDSNDPIADGIMTVATSVDFPPYEFYEGKEVVGIDPDIMKAIGEKLGVEVEFKDMDFNNIIASLGSKRADVGAAGMTVDEDRLKNADFTDTYASSIQVFMIKESSNIKNVKDLEGKKIATQLGTIGDSLANEDYEDVSAFAKYPDAVLALQNDKVDAILMDKTPAEKFLATNEGLKIIDGPYDKEEYAFAIAKGSDDFKEKLNMAIKELKDDGTIDKIVNKYK